MLLPWLHLGLTPRCALSASALYQTRSCRQLSAALFARPSSGPYCWAIASCLPVKHTSTVQQVGRAAAAVARVGWRQGELTHQRRHALRAQRLGRRLLGRWQRRLCPLSGLGILLDVAAEILKREQAWPRHTQRQLGISLDCGCEQNLRVDTRNRNHFSIVLFNFYD